DVVIVSARDGIEPLRRAAAEGATTLVVDVRSAEETRDCIRAGAGDMLAAEAEIGELAPRVSRLLRRRSSQKP
ncbi:MAG: hypothetical protein KF837_32000, partial [Labilithrix sp.]|nr:hypothetical protein [Labilithrix sp.]